MDQNGNYRWKPEPTPGPRPSGKTKVINPNGGNIKKYLPILIVALVVLIGISTCL